MYKYLIIALTVIGNIAFCQPSVDHSFRPARNAFTTGDSIFTLKGKITGPHKGFIKLYYTDKNGNWVIDSTGITNGAFKFTGIISEPTRAYLEGDAQTSVMGNPYGLDLFLEPTTITIELAFNKFKSAIIEGSKTEDEYQALVRSLAPVEKEKEPLNSEYNAATIPFKAAVKDKKSLAEIDSLRNIIEAIRDKVEPYNKRIAELHYDFFSNHPQSYVTAYYLRFVARRLPLDSIKLFYTRLGPTQKSTSGKYIAHQIEQMGVGQPGSIAKGFSSKEINGQQLSLSDYKGKYVLLDFWASWCIPCRRGNPHLKELYAKYKEKGMEFIGISDDDSKPDEWKLAIAEDGIGIWKHILRGLKDVNDKAGQSEDIHDKFGINSLPTKILIDKEGMIIGRFDDNEAPLDEMLKKIFGN